MSDKKIAFFASGSGSNFENIVTRLREQQISVQCLVLCNKPDAFVLTRAEKLEIPSYIFNRKQLTETGEVLEKLQEFNPDLIVLAGFLWLMPENIVNRFPGKIINIHPALLPAYGGKGMYGMLVHQSVVENKESRSGITIHFVNKHYDEGEYILQVSCPVDPSDTPETVAEKVHQLEYKHFPEVVINLLTGEKLK